MTDRLYAVLCPLCCGMGGMFAMLEYDSDRPFPAFVAVFIIAFLTGLSWMIATAHNRLIAEQNRLIDEMWARINKMDEERDDEDSHGD
jgi:hypothetical protein